ncbi:MAG: endonuclease VIII [Candidatus Azobacteroides sp.]|nr:endonuclease VIII [Candidatus Azobacteroides sp.]
MLEIPESKTMGEQVKAVLSGKKVQTVLPANSPHKFTWYNGDPLLYDKMLKGKTIIDANGHGMFVDIHFDSHFHLTIGDGTNMRYYLPYESYPKKYQLLIIFENESFLAFTVSMYGAIYVYEGELENAYHQKSRKSVSPLCETFDKSYFDNLFRQVKKNMSVKAFLATEQRIPGLGNGVLQDILFHAGLHPKRKAAELTDFEKEELFYSLKVTLKNMTAQGGRDTEKDLSGSFGKYKTLLSKNTYKNGCPTCGNEITKEAFMGGSVYYCNSCQKL